MKIRVSNIQHFSVGDGPGIRTTVFLKGCNLHCPWCHNPETISAKPERLRYEATQKEEICGTDMTVEEILVEVLADEEFYETSNGGVTLSGGEVMLQAEAVKELLKQLKEQNVSIWIDTAGDVPYERFALLNPYVDGYLYDYKTDSAEKYRNVIGGSLETVRNNLQTLIRDEKHVIVRVPMIPKFNTDMESIKSMRQTFVKIGVSEVNLLPFHRMGTSKYKALGKIYEYQDVMPLEKDEMEAIKEEFNKYIKTKVEY